MTAADDYRAEIRKITAVAEELRAQDEVRAAALERQLAVLDDRMGRVGERVAMSELAVRTHWETALDALWSEPWMTVPRFPRPDPEADPARLTRYEQEMYEAHAALMALVHRTRFGFRR
ncbi:hypothetical protein [Pseudonocardia xishanensis]|uniref:Uncharacterized protein n=1 Tax=Pseudonocardia xishanensis TaxID=630995 RepID=A0ABP8RV52_9PSEU